MQRKARFYGRERDFHLFSLSFPEESYSYNPLLNGTTEQIKTRLMDGLRFEQEYYKAQASLFLGGILSVFQFLKEPINFSLLDQYLNDTSKIKTLSKQVSEADTEESSEKEKTINELNTLLEQIQNIPKQPTWLVCKLKSPP